MISWTSGLSATTKVWFPAHISFLISTIPAPRGSKNTRYGTSIVAASRKNSANDSVWPWRFWNMHKYQMDICRPVFCWQRKPQINLQSSQVAWENKVPSSFDKSAQVNMFRNSHCPCTFPFRLSSTILYYLPEEKKNKFCFLSSELRTLLYFILMGSNFLMACCTDNGVQPAKSSSSTSIMPFLAQRSRSLYGKRMQKKCKHGIQWPFILKSTSPSYTHAHTRNENTFPVPIGISGLSAVACRT